MISFKKGDLVRRRDGKTLVGSVDRTAYIYSIRGNTAVLAGCPGEYFLHSLALVEAAPKPTPIPMVKVLTLDVPRGATLVTVTVSDSGASWVWECVE
jgi:hypothetical protein